jgi:hypothetical protein
VGVPWIKSSVSVGEYNIVDAVMRLSLDYGGCSVF